VDSKKILYLLGESDSPMSTVELMDGLVAYDIYPDAPRVQRVCRRMVEDGLIRETQRRQSKRGSRSVILAWEAI